MKRISAVAVATAALLGSGLAEAALHDRGGGLIYDDVLDVTWLQDANYAKTSGYDADGYMSWGQAASWASDLSFYDSVRSQTYNDWRLPTMIDTNSPGCNWAVTGTDCGYNVQTFESGIVYSELAHMYYVNLGLKGYYSPVGEISTDWGIFRNGTAGSGLQANVGPIRNLQSGSYWTDTDYAPYTSASWNFFMSNGQQDAGYKSWEFLAWAVRGGDVVAVPEPKTYAMLLAGLGLIASVIRRKTRTLT